MGCSRVMAIARRCGPRAAIASPALHLIFGHGAHICVLAAVQAEKSVSESRHVVCAHCGGVNRVPVERLGAGGKCGRCKTVLFDGYPAEVGSNAFQIQLTRSDVPLLVDFWAPWCGPCHMMAPAFEKAARQLEPGYRLLKVNTEEQQAIAAQFNIRSIPTMILFAHGREVSRMSGALDAAGIVAWARQQHA